MKVLVLAGGSSPEREVSLQSGTNVALALTFTGRFIADLRDPQDTDIASLNRADWDVAFPMVHGTGGEDGVLQRQLESLGLPFVGSSSDVSELTFDKIRTNAFLAKHQIAVPPSIVVRNTSSLEDCQTAIVQHGLPVVVKPPRQGSSIGVTIVERPEQIEAALTLAFQYDSECLVETFIPGCEVTVPVVNGQAFPTIEIRPATAWYDYDSKYVDDRTQYITDQEGRFQGASKIAVKACELCGVKGIARVDFRIDPNGTVWLLEVNTIPGMTSHSLVPKSAAAMGMSISELCEAAVKTVVDQL